MDDPKKRHGISPTDVLLIPDMICNISHRFTALEGRNFLNNKLKGQKLDIAQQDIKIRLDRSGVELKSEAKIICLPNAIYFIFNRPFLLYIKERGATMPFFVMWIDNAGLLNKWQPEIMA